MILREARITIKKRNALLKSFIEHLTAKQAGKMAGVSRNTANLYFNHFRQSIFEHYVRAPRFSGEVEIDECTFGKGAKRSKYDARVRSGMSIEEWRTYLKKTKLKRATQNVLVFGIQRRGGDVYTHIIKDRRRETLIPIIHLVVEGGSIILSDMHKSYDILQEDGYEHQQINHSQGFVNKKGIHIGTIESFWSSAKDHFRRFRGIARRTYPLHLKECEFRWNNRGDEKLMLKTLKRWAF